MANLLFLSLLLSSLLSLSLSCSDDNLTGGRTFQRCVDLDHLDASIHWTHFPANGSASFAFKVESAGWAAWGLNPEASGMIGTQAFVAGRNGTGVSFFTTSLTSKGIPFLSLGNISVSFADFTAESVNDKLIIYTKLTLPGNRTAFNHTWQIGPIRNGVLAPHPFNGENLRSFGTLNLASATNAAPGGGTPGGGTPGGGTPGSTEVKNGGDVGRKIGFASSLLLVAGIFFF